MRVVTPTPFALSLSKGCLSSLCIRRREGQGFDKLSPNGNGGIEVGN
jgi:hypothetical protein